MPVRPRPPACFRETVQDVFISPLYQQHSSHTLASRVCGPQPHMQGSSATGLSHTWFMQQTWTVLNMMALITSFSWLLRLCCSPISRCLLLAYLLLPAACHLSLLDCRVSRLAYSALLLAAGSSRETSIHSVNHSHYNPTRWP